MTVPTEQPWIEVVAGIKRRTLTTGATMYQMRARLETGSRLPEHQHPQEQIAYLLTGRLRMTVGGVTHELAPGDSVYIASNVPHSAETIEEATVIDTFSPPRDDYLAIDARAKSA